MKTRSQLEIDLPRAAIEEFCQRHGIRRASIFGSALGNQFRPESDADVLVEFEPGREPGLASLPCRMSCRKFSDAKSTSIRRAS